MRPVIRWTLGRPTNEGFEILIEAIRSWKKIYPEFIRVVSYNESKSKHIKFLKAEDVCLFSQVAEYNKNKERYLWKPTSAGWKLCPPRLQNKAHEITCDNDLIILERLPFLDEFLQSDIVFMCSAIRRSFGNFDEYVPPDIKMNSGMFGVPPAFDLEAKVLEMQKKSSGNGWDDIFDEQGMLAAIFVEYGKFKIIPMGEIYNCLTGIKVAAGVHFCGVNQGNIRPWKAFKTMRIGYL